MSSKKVVILNGTGNGEDCFDSPFSVLMDKLNHNNADVSVYRLKDLTLAHCTGCFGCWVKTPGTCVASDEGRKIIQSVIQSDMTILYSPVTFGGYSSVLKIIVDRFIPLVLPFFGHFHGETHHTRRYSRYPRLVGIGVRHKDKSDEDELFKALVGRNAINFHAPSFAADVISCEDDIEKMKKQLKNVITRSDPMPNFNDIASFFPKEVEKKSFDVRHKVPGNVLLIVGSPKIKHRSTSAILGEYLLEIMKSAGWKAQVLTLNRRLDREKGQIELCSAVDRSDLIILSFPLYIDSLPYLVTKALEVIASHKKRSQVKKPQRIFTIINNGFPENRQNALALAICRCFADQCGLSWSGALALGAGEALGGGQELTQKRRSGPPVTHVIKALDQAGQELAKGNTVYYDTQSLISKTPIPIIPFGMWNWIFTKLGGRWWIQQAVENGVTKEEMFAKPYDDKLPLKPALT